MRRAPIMLLAATGLLVLAYIAHRRFDQPHHRPEPRAESGRLDEVFQGMIEEREGAVAAARAKIEELLPSADAGRLLRILPGDDQPWRRGFAALTPNVPGAIEVGPRIMSPRGRMASAHPPVFVRGEGGPWVVEIAALSGGVDVTVEVELDGSRPVPLPENLEMLPGSAWSLRLRRKRDAEWLDELRFERLSEAELEEQRVCLALIRENLADLRRRGIAQALLALAHGLDAEAQAVLTRLPEAPEMQAEPLLDAMVAWIHHRRGREDLRDLALERHRLAKSDAGAGR